MLSEYSTYFSVSAGASASLIGLLFVAISLAPTPIFQEGGRFDHQIMVSATFAALSNTFLIALAGLLPGVNIGAVVVIIASSSLLSIFAVTPILWRLRGQRRVLLSQALLMLSAIVIYGLQGAQGILLIRQPGNHAALNFVALLFLPLFSLALARVWELIGAQRRGLSAMVTAVRQAATAPRDAP